MLCRVEIRWLTWPLKGFPRLCFETLLGFFGRIHLYCEALCRFIWLNLSRESSTIQFRLLPADTSSINAGDPVPLAVIHCCLPPCLIDDVVHFPFLLNSLLFSSFWCIYLGFIWNPTLLDGFWFWFLIWPSCSWIMVSTLLLTSCISVFRINLLVWSWELNCQPSD